MFSKKKKSYVDLQKTRIFYNEQTDTVSLTSKDPAIPKGESFKLTLNNGTQAEKVLRAILAEHGVIPNSTLPDWVRLPELSTYPTNPQKIPLGISSRGELVWDTEKDPHMFLAGMTGGGKSAIQRNILFSCLSRPEHWRVAGIDVKRVELSPYEKYPNFHSAKDIDTGRMVIEWANEEMMCRYEEMERAGVTSFRDLPNYPKSVLVMIDEAYMFLDGCRKLEAEQKPKYSTSTLLSNIARLGRAAGIHLVVATQNPSDEVFSDIRKSEFGIKIAAGRMTTEASVATLNNDKASLLPDIKGRGYVEMSDQGMYGLGMAFQSYFAPQELLDQHLAK